MDNEYRKMLLKSLTEDIKYWYSESMGVPGYYRVEWHSKNYKSKSGDTISFCVGHLNYGTCAIINGRVKYIFSYIPFISKIAIAIRKMKKYVHNKNEKDFLEELKRAIDLKDE